MSDSRKMITQTQKLVGGLNVGRDPEIMIVDALQSTEDLRHLYPTTVEMMEKHHVRDEIPLAKQLEDSWNNYQSKCKGFFSIESISMLNVDMSQLPKEGPLENLEPPLLLESVCSTTKHLLRMAEQKRRLETPRRLPKIPKGLYGNSVWMAAVAEQRKKVLLGRGLRRPLVWYPDLEPYDGYDERIWDKKFGQPASDYGIPGRKKKGRSGGRKF